MPWPCVSCTCGWCTFVTAKSGWQCDQIAGFLCYIWAFAAPKNCPKAYKICQSTLKMFPNTKQTLSEWPKLFNVVPKWQNFAKSGHPAVRASVERRRCYRPKYDS